MVSQKVTIKTTRDLHSLREPDERKKNLAGEKEKDRARVEIRWGKGSARLLPGWCQGGARVGSI